MAQSQTNERFLQLVSQRMQLNRRPVMWQLLEAEAYLMRLKDGRSVRLLDITKLAAWETEYEHWTFSVVRTGR